jgi:hypothetical protein
MQWLIALEGVMSSFSSILIPSAIGWSKPNGPTRRTPSVLNAGNNFPLKRSTHHEKRRKQQNGNDVDQNGNHAEPVTGRNRSIKLRI